MWPKRGVAPASAPCFNGSGAHWFKSTSNELAANAAKVWKLQKGRHSQQSRLRHTDWTKVTSYTRIQ